jgi:hypothetical protein
MTLRASFVQQNSYSYTPAGAPSASTIVTYQDGKNPNKYYATIAYNGTTVLTNRPHSSEQHAYQAGVTYANLYNAH